MHTSKLTHLILSLSMALALTACGDAATDEAADTNEQETSTTDSSTSAAGLDIAGDYVDSWGSSHTITENMWTTDGSSMFHIAYMSNEEQVVIAQNDDENEYNPSLWSRFDWTENDAGLWYCQTAYAAETQDAAMATEAADATDPETAGCGGFGWTKLEGQAQ